MPDAWRHSPTMYCQRARRRLDSCKALGVGLAAAVSFHALAPPGGASEIEPPAAIHEEASRRHEALVHDGFNLTRGVILLGGETQKPLRAECFVPMAGRHTLSFWLEVPRGEAVVRLLGPAGERLLEASARRLEWVVERDLPVGTYVLEIDATATPGGEAVFGVKGAVVAACSMDRDRASEISASPADGFHWPYLLFVPEHTGSPHLLVVPNNTGFATKDPALLRASASCAVVQHAPLAARLGAAMLVPLFPRPRLPGQAPDNLYLHALTREALTTRSAAWSRVDLQLPAMVRHARARLASLGWNVEKKLLLVGFSASASFVNRFAMLHPENVLAVVAGSPGGWPIAPVRELAGEPLTYPVGIADLEDLAGRPPDLAALRGVRWLDARFVLYSGAGHSLTPAMRADAEAFLTESVAGAAR